jgi:tetratricopeptide (TPR) repeat protein
MDSDPKELISSGFIARREGRLDDARQLFADAVDFAGEPATRAHALTCAGQIERDLGDDTGALERYQEAAGIFRKLNDPLKLAHTVRHVADILSHQGMATLAARCYDESIAIYRKNPATPPLDLANTLRGYAMLKVQTGAEDGAKLLWKEARDLYAAAGVEAGVQESDAHL